MVQETLLSSYTRAMLVDVIKTEYKSQLTLRAATAASVLVVTHLTIFATRQILLLLTKIKSIRSA